MSVLGALWKLNKGLLIELSFYVKGSWELYSDEMIQVCQNESRKSKQTETPALAGGVLTTGSPGKSLDLWFLA